MSTDMTIEMMLAMTGLQRKVEELTVEMAKATIVINQQQDYIETLQTDHDKMVDVVHLQAEVSTRHHKAIERLEKLQKEQSPIMWPGFGQ